MYFVWRHLIAFGTNTSIDIGYILVASVKL